MNIIYFDHNATTPIFDSVKSEMINLFDSPYNPSSLHQYGRKAKYIIEDARINILKLLDINPKKYDLVFTSSGTEANNLILSNYKDEVILTSPTEHLSIINCASFCRNITFIKLQNNGLIDLNNLEEELIKAQSSKNILVSIIYANNETGIIERIKEIADLCSKYGARFHTDSAQAIGKIDFNIEDLNLDFVTISGHKFGGPIGSACLIYKKNVSLLPLIYGGGQEKNLRSGTENLITIHGMYKALEITISNLKSNIEKMKGLRNLLEDLVVKKFVDIKIIGKELDRLPNTSNIVMRGISSEKQIIQFDLNNVAISSGSACSSGKIGKSHVLKAMNLSDEDARCAVRISLGPTNSEDEIYRFIDIWSKIVNS